MGTSLSMIKYNLPTLVTGDNVDLKFDRHHVAV